MPRQNAARSMSLTSQESYSAVIIADMVAEVQSPPENPDIVKGRKNSSKLENGVDVSSSAGKKVEVNLGYDGQTDTTKPAVVNVDLMDSNRANGTDISKGVILNAQFGSLNKKADNLITEKSIEMNNALPAQASDAKKESKVSTDFKHMSGPRKVAFIFSFLPSIMFVLCFAVILPCEKKLPCIQEMWSLTLNDTEITTRLQLSSEKLFYSYVNGVSGSNGVISLDVESGNQAWNSSVSYVPHLKGCGKLVETSSEACLVTGRSGLFELLNASSGVTLRQLNINSTDNPPMFRYDPVLLPDCLGDGISEYGFAVSHNEIKVVYQGYISSSVSVSSCDTEPEKLTPWTSKNNKTDLIFICRKDGKGGSVRFIWLSNQLIVPTIC
ncbi:unnamed protein product [Larinioides sclopetarius]|uniref:Uncharacterized protein n=1 Tax=Larinioides sclopetarius TaxID=280406 RepID=A0AAV1ZG32_9ARAC